MPGRIVMDSHAAPTTNGLKNNPPPIMASTAAPPADHVTNGHSNGTIKEEERLLPPELDNWAHTYVPMGKLLERMAQQCYFDLNEVIEHMADLNIASPQPNDASSSGPDASRASVDKKLRLMNFASSQKDRFIKALVLSDWARNMGEMDKMIDLRMWLQQQDDASSLTSDAIMHLKHNMIGAKMPNPNIQGALELLSTSKAPWFPDLGYVPSKPLSAQKLLKTLRDMNFVLSVRLNLHEQLPPHFCNYSIANGRATFVVSDEFELDLAVTDEDTSSPFYFIDIRFLFADAPQLPDGFARMNLEGKVNQILQVEGLSAAYDFLHGFVLTHKVTLLRRQAFELSRTRWTECLHIEPIHRSLIVQYWTGQPGPKSWIEIGVSKPSPAQTADQAPKSARLNVRWFRAGKEIPNVKFDIDPANPSIEHLLNQVTAAHMNYRLATIRDQLLAISPSNSTLDMSLHTSPAVPNACSLTMKLGQHGMETVLRIIPVNGNMSISPVTAISIDVERRLNADPTIDAAQIVTYLNCKLVQDQITRQAVQSGWLLIPTDKQSDTNKIFGEQVVRRTTFTRRGWGEDWAIAVTVSLSGVKWWIAHLTTTPTSRAISTVETLSIPASTKAFDRQILMLIESRAVAQVSLSNITSQLRNSKISHEIKHMVPSATQAQTLSSPSTTAVIGIKFEDMMQPSSSQYRNLWKPWCHSTTVLTHHGIDESSRDDTKVVHVLKTTLTPSTAENLQPCVGQSAKDQDIFFGVNGILALKLRTHFGVNLIALIQQKLRRVERLAACLAAIKKRGFSVDCVSVSGLVFAYQVSPPLKLGVLFADDAASPIQLRFAPEDTTNPHRSVLPLLQKLLQTNTAQSSSSSSFSSSVIEETRRFEIMLDLLHATLPLLNAIREITNQDPESKRVSVAVRSLLHYRIIYSSPSPSLPLNVELKRKQGKDIWALTLIKELIGAQDKEKMLDLLGEAWQGKELAGIKGFRSGIVCEVAGVEKVLMNLDAAVGGLAAQDPDHEVVVLD